MREGDVLLDLSRLSRRRFLRLAAGGTGAALLGGPLGCEPSALSEDPFTLGVASGDPLSDRVMLWTRLAPRPLEGGGMPPRLVEVLYEVAHDPGFQVVVRSGLANAWPHFGHAVKVDVEGLQPDRWYWYRFRVGGWVSPVGRTRTMPAAGASPGLLRFATASCQRYLDGFFTAYANLAQEDLDFVVHLGDYIYASGQQGTVRDHQTGTLQSLEDYRNRHALYKLDPDLQEAHRLFPWIHTWDDNDVSNNYAGLVQDEGSSFPPPEQFAETRARAYRAWYEHLPVRTAVPQGAFLPIFRRLDFGDLLRFHVLDTRQHRSNQPCNDQLAPGCPGFPDPSDTMLGAEQEAWLLGGLRESRHRWDVLAQSVVFTPTLFLGASRNFDQWDGYPFARQRIVDASRAGTRNLVVLSGDIHTNVVAGVLAAEQDPTLVGSEFVATGISSVIADAGQAQLLANLLQIMPHVQLADGGLRGYLRHEVTRADWRCDVRGVATTLQPTSGIATTASFVVEDELPGPVAA